MPLFKPNNSIAIYIGTPSTAASRKATTSTLTATTQTQSKLESPVEHGNNLL